jgi:hypothetical protein
MVIVSAGEPQSVSQEEKFVVSCEVAILITRISIQPFWRDRPYLNSITVHPFRLYH